MDDAERAKKAEAGKMGFVGLVALCVSAMVGWVFLTYQRICRKLLV